MSTSARIFLNYRRADSAGWARQLDSDLGERFGDDRVFRDVAIEPGVDYVDHIERVMDACQVCIAVIGPRWANATTLDGHRRLDDPDDLVSLEIQRALERPDVRVIPVLVDGANMPGEHELPARLRPLARRNACELTDVRWDYDVEVLCRGLRHALGESSVEHERRHTPVEDAPARDSGRPAAPVGLAAMATLVTALLAGLAATLLSDSLRDPGGSGWAHVARYAVERGVIWAIIGAVVAGAAAQMFGRIRSPLGHALAGAVAGGLGGAAGGAAFQVMKQFGHLGGDSHWLLTFVVLALPALPLAVVLARAAGARAGECALAALAGPAVAGLLTMQEHRMERLTVHAVLVVGAIVAVAVAPSLSHRVATTRTTAAV